MGEGRVNKQQSCFFSMLKSNIIKILVLLTTFSASCTNKHENDHLPSIDIRKDYPDKEIILNEIADVTYLHLDTENKDYLYKGGIRYITENTIVVIDASSGSILFFSKDGSPKSRFNHYGIGPEEYSEKMFFLVYDENSDDVYVNTLNFLSNSHSIPVYSSTGEFKRKLILPACPFPLVDFDEQSLFLYNLQNQRNRILRKETDIPPQLIDSSYCRISKKDGQVIEYLEFQGNEVDLTIRGRGNRSIKNYMRVVKSSTGVFLCNQESDTVFLYNKDNDLKPVICKTPLVNTLDTKIILKDFVEAGRYQFLSVETLLSFTELNKLPLDERNKHIKHYVRDKQTGEIFHQKIRLIDYKEKDFIIDAFNTYFTGKEILTHFDLDLVELKQAYRENKLSGKLKELVATLDEFKDNNVNVFICYK